MGNSVLVLGGYGNFGRRIVRALIQDGIAVVIAGRDVQKADALVEEFREDFPECDLDKAVFDVHASLDEQLEKLKPTLVIHTCGPFQGSSYAVAESCIAHGVHYVDLADGRDFVTRIGELDQKAREKEVLVVSGASAVPGLSSAVIEHYKDNFSAIDSLVYGLSPGNKTKRGLATTAAVMSYVGKPLKPFAGHEDKPVYGWQDLYMQKYPVIGRRWMANCEIPDLDLLPERYGIKSITFSAGVQIGMMHLALWALSWLVRWRIIRSLSPYAKVLHALRERSRIFGTYKGGMHIILTGKDRDGNAKEIRWFIIAEGDDGPQIPCVPAIVLAKKMISGDMTLRGAHPCVGLVSLEEYMKELEGFSITTYVD